MEEHKKIGAINRQSAPKFIRIYFIEEIQAYFFARDFPVCTIIVLPAFFAK